MRRLIAAVLTLFMIGPAAGFPLELQVDNRINDLEDPATFKLEIKNSFSSNQTFKASVGDVKESWWFYDNNFKELGPRETETLDFNVNATKDTISGRHNFTVAVRTNSGERNSTSSYFILEKKQDVYFSNIDLTEQRTDLRITTEVYNTLPETLEEVNITVTGPENYTKTESIVVDSGSREEITSIVDKPEAPGNYSIKFSSPDGESNPISYLVTEEIKEENTQVEKGVEIDKEWDRDLMTAKLTITAENPGNSENTATIDQKFPVFLAPITSFDPKPDNSQIIGGEQRVTWNINLGPGETETISYSTSYKMPLIALGLLVIALLGLKTLEKQPRIEKEVKRIDSGAQVTLHIENHSSNAIDRLEVKDFITSVMEVDELKVNEPVIAKTDNGTRLEWDIEDMQAGESRALVYTVKPNFEGSADIHFPEAEMSSQQTGITESEKVKLESLEGN